MTWLIAAAIVLSALAPSALALRFVLGERVALGRFSCASYLDRGLQSRVSGAPEAGAATLRSCDLNDMTHPDGLYRLIGCRYAHSPDGLKTGFLYVQTAGAQTVQTFYSVENHRIWTRAGKLSWAGGAFAWSWPDTWKRIGNDEPKSRPITGKYVAFGDSLVWGSVWSPTPGGVLHQVTEAWQIPTRIALATGMSGNFENMGIGNIGYIRPVNGENIADKVQNYDFSDVSLVTIQAGANDKSAFDLGAFSDSESAETICGAIRRCIRLIRAANPETKIVIIQPPPSGVNGNTQDVWSTVPEGWKWSMNQFDAQVSQLCYDEQVGYVNWVGCDVCYQWRYIGYSGTLGPNYTHPTDDEAYLALGDFIGEKVAGVLQSYG